MIDIMAITTEKDALIAYAKMLNTGEVEAFISLLSPDFRYASQSVFSEIEGKDDFRDYIESKLETIRKNPTAKVFAELGETNAWGHEHCVLMAQGSKDDLVATLFVKLEQGCVIRADMCLIPAPQTVRRTGIYPRVS